MTDMISEGKYGQALQKLQTLLKMQEEPIGILAMIGRQFRQIGTARTLLDNGKGEVKDLTQEILCQTKDA